MAWPVTGVVDEETFRVIVNAYDLADELLSLSEAAVLHFPSGLVIKSEQSHPHLRLAQSIFQALHQEFPAFKAARLPEFWMRQQQKTFEYFRRCPVWRSPAGWIKVPGDA